MIWWIIVYYRSFGCTASLVRYIQLIYPSLVFEFLILGGEGDKYTNIMEIYVIMCIMKYKEVNGEMTSHVWDGSDMVLDLVAKTISKNFRKIYRVIVNLFWEGNMLNIKSIRFLLLPVFFIIIPVINDINDVFTFVWFFFFAPLYYLTV